MVPFSPGILLLPLFVCGILAVSRRDHEDLLCGENEHYLRCSGCEPSCKVPNPMCLMMCYPPKCQCLDGFFRNDEGRCVPLVQCVLEAADVTPPPHILPHDPEHAPSDGCENPNHCGENEKFYGEDECASSCEPSCTKPYPRTCNKKCNFNVCRCLDGFVRHPSGKCVPLSYCPLPEQHECGENAEYAAGEECDINCEGNHILCDNPRVRQCRCLPGFVRDIGQCVPQNRCPRPEFRCGANEKYIDEDNCGTACEPSCLNLHPRNCPRMCVKNVCQCENGFVRNPLTKECILESQCPKKLPIPTCSKNEEYTLGGRCDPTCDGHEKCTLDLVVKCRCLRGYVRSSSGICIPKNDCPTKYPICGENEEYENGSPCEPTCDDPKVHRVCTMDLVNKCRCLRGFVRGSSGNCIPENQCPKLKVEVCGVNEEYVEDGKNCESLCDGAPKPHVPCDSLILMAIPGCKCLEGFARHSSGNCIPKIFCPEPKPTCPQNETYVEGGSACNEPTCKSPERPIDEMCMDIFNGCQCSIGFVRDEESRKCVRVDHCPKPKPTCAQNETFQEHGSICEPSCKEPQGPVACPLIDYRGCKCSPGFVRSYAGGNCIRLSHCTKLKVEVCAKEEEYVEDGKNCESLCDGAPKPWIPCGSPILMDIPGCKCLKGFARHPNGKCVPKFFCPKPVPECPQNERYVVKGPKCEASCEHPEKPKICPMIAFTGCTCIPGFVRDNGKCMRPSQCPKPKPTCAQNETYQEHGSICENSCEKPQGPRACIYIDYRGCRCSPGFVRDNGKCIRLSNCPKPKPTCPQNETYVEHGSRCEELTCKNPDSKPSICRDDFTGCQCTPGFVRDEESEKCIRSNNCPNHDPVCGENEEGNDGGLICDRTCKSKGAYDCNQHIIRQCRCKQGYVRLNDTECVRLYNCPEPKPTCPQNETYIEAGSACNERTCEDPYPLGSYCLDDFSGCQCSPGFARDEHSRKCIPLSQCPEPKPKCPQNETYIERGSRCNERTCKNPYPIGSGCRDNFYGCQCSPGFARDKESQKCIPLSQCPLPEPSCDKNEVYESGSHCENSCDDPNAERECTKQLETKCRCLPGFVRRHGKCVLLSRCPRPKPSCDRNEKYVECGKECEPSCENPKPSACIMRCIKGCVCLSGYVRNPSGHCVPESFCPEPKPKCPRNETYVEGGSVCDERTCENPLPSPTPRRCLDYFVGCQCSPGYVRDKESGKCIRVDHCPKPKPACSQNETYVEFGSSCDERTCEYPQRPNFPCFSPFSGCQCSIGFVRNKESGKCIRVDHCPKPKPACSQNETYVEHGLKCESSCTNSEEPDDCSLLDFTGCKCSPGFVRDKDSGKCVRVSHCPKPELHACGRNEMYVDNGNGCEPTCFDPHPKWICKMLKTGCFCKSGHVRDPENKCIPESKCSDSLIRAGDDKFRHCCIDNGLPKEYLQVCNYTATIELTKLMIEYLSPNKSPRDHSSAVDVANTVLKCFTGGKDVSQCCRGKGVKESCLPICSAALYEISHVNPANLMECLDLEDARPNGVAREILKLAETGTECFAEANAR